MVLLLSSCQLMKQNHERLRITVTPFIDKDTFSKHQAGFVETLKLKLEEKGFVFENIELFYASTHQQAAETLTSGYSDAAYLNRNNFQSLKGSSLKPLVTRLNYQSSPELLDESQLGQKSALLESMQWRDRHHAAIFLGVSDKAQELKSISSEKDLSWIDINSAHWCYGYETSLEDYVAPSYWLRETYSRRIGELYKKTRVQNTAELMRKLANGECDIAVGHASLREQFEETWNRLDDTGFGRQYSIYTEVEILTLTRPIMHHLFATASSSRLPDNLWKALGEALIEMAEEKDPLLQSLGIDALGISDSSGYDAMDPLSTYLTELRRLY